MLYIRSILFHICFYLATIILGTFFLWVMILPRDYAWAVMYHGYFKTIALLEKYILGLTYEVEGQENIPKQGAYIIAMKHQSAYETMKLFHLFGDVRIIYKRQLSWIPIWGWYMMKMGMISVDRGAKGAMQSLINNATPVIEQGKSIAIYPQGTRVSIHDTPETRPYKYGIMKLYGHFQVPILPVAMNSGKFWPRQSLWIKPGVVKFKILPTIPKSQNQQEAFQFLQEIIEVESKKLL